MPRTQQAAKEGQPLQVYLCQVYDYHLPWVYRQAVAVQHLSCTQRQQCGITRIRGDMSTSYLSFFNVAIHH